MYEIEFHPHALEDLERLDRATANRILKKIHWLAVNIDSMNPEALVGGFEGLFKLRVGDYRVIYQVNRQRNALRIELVGHRREIYR